MTGTDMVQRADLQEQARAVSTDPTGLLNETCGDLGFSMDRVRDLRTFCEEALSHYVGMSRWFYWPDLKAYLRAPGSAACDTRFERFTLASLDATPPGTGTLRRFMAEVAAAMPHPIYAECVGNPRLWDSLLLWGFVQVPWAPDSLIWDRTRPLDMGVGSVIIPATARVAPLGCGQAAETTYAG
jgi:hypothetical protein